MSSLIKIAITGGAGRISYNLLYRIASGELFGSDQRVSLQILEVGSVLSRLQGVVMELRDCSYPNLVDVKIGDNPEDIFDGVDYAVLIGAFPRKRGMERSDLLECNGKIFKEQSKFLGGNNVRIMVVGNPCNTNALVLLHNNYDIGSQNIRSLSRLDENRARSMVASKAQQPVHHVKDIFIYGNHSPTMVVDYLNCRIMNDRLTDLLDISWLRSDLMRGVQGRGAEILNITGASSAASAASAIIDALRDWHFAVDDIHCSGVYTAGNRYGVDGDLFFSFPLSDGNVIEGLTWDDFIENKIKISEKELIEERDLVRGFLC